MKLRYILALLFVFLAVSLLTVPAAAYTVPDSTIVYVTPSGDCYHRKGCSYTSDVTPMTIAEAVREGYRACSRCDPDELKGVYIAEEPDSSGSKNGSVSNGSISKDTSAAKRKLTGEDIFNIILVSFFALAILLGIIENMVAKRRRKKSEKMGKKKAHPGG